MQDQRDRARGLAGRLTQLMTCASPISGDSAVPARAADRCKDRELHDQLIREIRFISDRYGWSMVIDAALDRTGVRSLRQLDHDALEQLLERMRAMVDNAMAGCDLADDLPAR
jgi:hypothetical protein